MKIITKYCHTWESHIAAAMKKYIGSFEQRVEAERQVAGAIN